MTETELEKAIVGAALERLQLWKTENPEGLLPFGSQRAVRSASGHRLIELCLKLDKIRTDSTTT